MASWLSADRIAKFDKKFAGLINDTNATESDGEYDFSDWSSAKTFEEYLYLDYKFVIGDLCATPTHGAPLVDGHAEDCGDQLAELVKYGVFTHHGQEPDVDNLISLLDFVVLIHDDNIPAFILFLKGLHSAGVNIGAQAAKGDTLIKQYVFATSSEGLTLMDDDFKAEHNTQGVYKEWYANFACNSANIFDWGIDRAGLNEHVMNYKKDTHTRFHCEMWGRFFDGKKVEDTFVPLWKVFNDKFGKKNQS